MVAFIIVFCLFVCLFAQSHSHVWIDLNVSTCSPVDGRVNYFQFGAITNEAAMSIRARVSVWASAFLLWSKQRGVEWLDPMRMSNF